MAMSMELPISPNVFLSDGQAEENMERCRLRHEDYRLESRVMQGVPRVYRLFGQGHTQHHNYFHKIDVLLIPLSLPLSNLLQRTPLNTCSLCKKFMLNWRREKLAT